MGGGEGGHRVYQKYCSHNPSVETPTYAMTHPFGVLLYGVPTKCRVLC